MAVTVGELQVTIEANTEEFRRGVLQLERRLASFEQNSNRRLTSIANGFQFIRRAIIGVGGALAAIAVGRGIGRLVSGAIEAAAEFEALEVRLRSFTGSQEEAAAALQDFIELSAQTPFSVAQVAASGATLAAVALGNRDALLELTQTATNLAAVTGLGLTEAAGNLQRTLTAGIASADLFRERGVRALIEAVQDIPDLTALPLEEANAAVLATFGPDGVFASAASDLQFTLGGALSNVGDAVQRFAAAFGDAISPAVVATLREFVIPLFDRLRVLVEENSDEIRDFAFNALRAAVDAFVALVRTLAFVARGLAAFQRGIRTARANINQLAFAVAVVTRAGNDTLTTLAELQQELEAEAAEETVLDQFANGAEALSEEINRLQRNFENIDFDNVSEQSEEAEANLKRVRAALEAARARQDEGGGVIDARTVAQQESALRRIEQLVVRIGDAEAAETEPLTRKLNILDRQLDALQEINRTKENGARIDAAQTALAAEQLRLTDQLADAARRQAEAQTNVSGLLGQLRILDTDAADQLAEDFAEAFESARGSEARARVAEDFAEKVQDALDEVRPELPGAAESIAGVTRDALRAAFTEEGTSFADSFGQLLQQRAQEGLDEAFGKALDGLENALTEAFEAAGSVLEDTLEGSSGGFGQFLGRNLGTIAGPLAALATNVVGAALRDNEQIETSAANIASAVTNAQAVRGVVAGPTSIGVAQVGRSVQDAFVESERLLGLIARSTAQTAANTGGSGQAGTIGAEGDPDAIVEANESASLI